MKFCETSYIYGYGWEHVSAGHWIKYPVSHPICWQDFKNIRLISVLEPELWARYSGWYAQSRSRPRDRHSPHRASYHLQTKCSFLGPHSYWREWRLVCARIERSRSQSKDCRFKICQFDVCEPPTYQWDLHLYSIPRFIKSNIIQIKFKNPSLHLPSKAIQ